MTFGFLSFKLHKIIEEFVILHVLIELPTSNNAQQLRTHNFWIFG